MYMKSFFKSILVYVLTFLARATLAIFKPKIIAITGNIGKTSTKDAISAVMAKQYLVRGSHKSFNSEIGVPLTILGEDNQWGNVFGWIAVCVRATLRLIVREEYPTWLILEVGADKPNDIRTITEWLRPHIVVLTQFGEVPVHIENFKNDRDLVIKEKAYLPQALKKNGIFIFYGDDLDTQGIAQHIQHAQMTFGFRDTNTVQILETKIMYTDKGIVKGMEYIIKTPHAGIITIQKEGFLGNTYASACAAACVIAQVCGVESKYIQDALTAYVPEAGRMRIIEGIKNTILIDDTYNAAPKAMQHALDTLGAIDTPHKKIAILGDMLELGKHTEKAHRNIGAKVASVAHILITVGIRARFIVTGALDAGMKDDQIFQFENSRSAGKFAESLIQEGDIILLKASQGIRMERATEELLRYPEFKSALLPRQSNEWQKR